MILGYSLFMLFIISKIRVFASIRVYFRLLTHKSAFFSFTLLREIFFS